MDKMKPVFTAMATAIGGRNGHTETTDGAIKADLSLPKEVGGQGKPGLATPEHLFAAGYAACFGGALDFVAKQKKCDATKGKITCAVSIGPRDADGVNHGFVRDPKGAITSFDGPGAGTTKGNGSVGEMITDAGTIPGVSLDNNGLNQAFIRYRNGTFVTFGVTGAGTAPGQGTLAMAANVAGTTGGNYYDANGVSHGVVRSRDGSITTFDVPGEGTGSGQGVTGVTSINARAQRWDGTSILMARTTASSTNRKARTTEAQVNSINYGDASWRIGSSAVKRHAPVLMATRYAPPSRYGDAESQKTLRSWAINRVLGKLLQRMGFIGAIPR